MMLSRYIVNATLTVAAWVEVEAEDAEEAAILGESVRAQDFEYDLGTAEVEFNVTPEVTLAA